MPLSLSVPLRMKNISGIDARIRGCRRRRSSPVVRPLRLDGFTLSSRHLSFCRRQQMPFSVVAKTTGLSWYHVHAICARYVDDAVEIKSSVTFTVYRALRLFSRR